MISYEEALKLIRNTSKYSHALMVSRMMWELARVLDENEQEWMLVGLLHDLDYDEVKDDMRWHGVVAAEKLKGKLHKNCVYAIKVHDYRTGFKPKSRLDKALIAADSLAVLMERFRETAEELTVNRLRAELEETSATEPWHKNNVMKCVEIGLKLNEFLQLCLDSQKKKAYDL